MPKNHVADNGEVIWSAALDARLGKAPDRILAEEIGCSNEAIRRRRARLNVAAFRPESPWTERDDSIVQKHPVAEAAKRLGRSPVSVRIRRHRLGITCYKKRK